MAAQVNTAAPKDVAAGAGRLGSLLSRARTHLADVSPLSRTKLDSASTPFSCATTLASVTHFLSRSGSLVNERKVRCQAVRTRRAQLDSEGAEAAGQDAREVGPEKGVVIRRRQRKLGD